MARIFLILGILLSNKVFAASGLKKVGGEFQVQSVKPSSSGFTVTFKNTAKNAEIKEIKLESSHIHVSIGEGKILRLSAEVSSLHNGIVEARQVLVFLPTPGSYLPIWLLSNKASGLSDLTGSKYLDMHAPQSDFLLF